MAVPVGITLDLESGWHKDIHSSDSAHTYTNETCIIRMHIDFNIYDMMPYRLSRLHAAIRERIVNFILK